MPVELPPGQLATNSLLWHIIREGAWELRITPDELGALIEWRAEADWRKFAKVPDYFHHFVIQRLKVMAGLPPESSQIPLEGLAPVCMSDPAMLLEWKFELKMWFQPGHFGESAHIRWREKLPEPESPISLPPIDWTWAIEILEKAREEEQRNPP